MKRPAIVMACLLLCAAALDACLADSPEPAKQAACAEARREKLKVLRGKADQCSTLSCWSPWLRRKWTTDKNSAKPLSEEELAAISGEYCAVLKEMLDLAPDDAKIAFEYGDALMFSGKYAEAERVYRRVHETCFAGSRRDAFKIAQSEYRIAEALFAQGFRSGAKDQLKTLVDRKLVTNRRGVEDWSAYAKASYDFLSGAVPCATELPRWTGAKAFPEPQRVEYTDDFAPLSEVSVRLVGVKRDDPRVDFLVRRLAARGIKAAIGGRCPYSVTLAIDAKAPVERSEGYTLEIGEKEATVRARDGQGVLWGVVSFIQCLSDTERAVRICRMDDWPDTARRGYLGSCIWSGCLEFTIFCKMNSVVLQDYPGDSGRDTPLNVFQCTELARQFGAFGLELYFGISNYTMGLGWAYSWAGTLSMHVERCCHFAQMGANVYYPNDDMRYPVHADDTAKGLNASDVDAPHVLALYNAVREKYPKFKMVYCPPFYWGPDSSAAYPDDREKYLKSLRILPPELDLYWTGGQVKGYNKCKRQVEWFTNLTGHRPVIFQNGTGAHNLLSYLVDETDWNGWHYPGFFENDIAAFHKNSHTPNECVQISTLGDCLWNVKGYDKRRSVERGVAFLLGEDMFSILKPGLEGLTRFDRYKYGDINADILYDDLDELRKAYETASNCWAKAVAYNPEVQVYGAYGRGVGFAARVLAAAKNPPDFFAKYAQYLAAARAEAVKETAFDKEKGDLMYLPTDMSGPQMGFYKHPNVDEYRFVKFIRGAQTVFSASEMKFECDPFPPAGDYELYVAGMDDEVEGLNDIELSVNGKVFYSGPSGFVPRKYTMKKFRIPFDRMERHNKLKIRNLGMGANANGPPYIAIAYVVLKKTGENSSR